MTNETTPVRVLLVDDDEDDVFLVSRCLAEARVEGGTVLERVASAAAALDRLRRDGFDLLLLDYRIGPDDGLDLLRDLRARGVRTPAILLTGQGREEVAVEAMKSGAADYLAKGRLTPAALGAAARYALELHRSHGLQAAAEVSLRESEARYRRIFEQSLTGNYVSTPGGRIVSCNLAFARMFGYGSIEEILAVPAYDLYPDAAARDGFLDTMSSSAFIEGHEMEMRRRDGTPIFILENVVSLRHEDGRLVEIQGSALDITERKRVEAASRASEARALAAEASLRSLIDNAVLGIYRSTADGRFLSANPALVRMLGYDSEAELLAVDISSLYRDPAERQVAVAHFERAQPGDGVEVEWRRRDGGTIQLRLTGRAVQTGAIEQYEIFAEDVTQRRRSDEALRASESRYRLLFESNPQPMWVYDLETSRFLAVNEAAVVSYGYSREELLAMTIADIRPVEDQPRLAAHLEATNAGVDQAGVLRHRRKDGRLMSVEITSHTLDYAGRRAELVLARDVTAQRLLEEQLRRAQRMESLGRLAGGVAHDFNNYLGVIAGYAELVREQVDRASPLRGWVDEIVFAAERAAAVTRQLLAFGRKQVVSPQPLDLKLVLEECGGLLRRLLGEDVELEVRVEEGVARVFADRVQFEQVVVNLAVNARDAMPGGGLLLLAAENVEIDCEHQALHPDVAPGRYVALAVTDTGTGMDADVRSRIFEPFFTTKEPGKGSGLGLATVFGIVQQSGGHVTVDSEVGVGSTFRVYLPRAEIETRTDAAATAATAPAEPATSSTSDPAGSSVGGRAELVLLVEDDDVLRRVIGTMLRGAGYEVLDAADAETARTLAAEHAARLQLLVSDVMLRGARGPDLARTIARFVPGLRVLFVSGYADHALLQEGRLGSGRAFLAKPFTGAELCRAVRKLLDGAES